LSGGSWGLAQQRSRFGRLNELDLRARFFLHSPELEEQDPCHDDQGRAQVILRSRSFAEKREHTHIAKVAVTSPLATSI